MNDDQQLSFTDGVLRELARTTKRAQFLDKMNSLGGHPKAATHGHLKTGQRSVATFKTGQ